MSASATSTVPGRLALCGSDGASAAIGEIEAWIAEGSSGTLVHLTTAAALDGEHALRAACERGEQAARRLGMGYSQADIRTRADAMRDGSAAAFDGAGAIFVADGNARHLARTLRATPAWDALLGRWRSGTAVAAFGAGAVALGGYVPDARHPAGGGEQGLGLLADLRLVCHFDRLASMIPDSVLHAMRQEGSVVVGIDSDTALTSSGPEPLEEGNPLDETALLWAFRSRGKASAWRLDGERRRRINAPLRLRVRDT